MQLIFTLILLLYGPPAQPQSCPHHDAACPHTNTITMTVDAPDWLDAYPEASATIDDFLDAERTNYMIMLTDAEFDFIRRELVFEATYTETYHSDNIVTLRYLLYEDVGGLYPLDSLHTFTFDLREDTLLTISDMFIEEVEPGMVLAPIVATQLGPDVFGMAPPSVYIEEYEMFVLSETTLAILYPQARSGPTHAGMIPVEIPLEQLADVLNMDVVTLPPVDD